jgi:enoyl-CoA hydratase
MEKSFINQTFNNLIVSIIDNKEGLKVCQIQLNRPQVLNALNNELMGELLSVLQAVDRDKDFGCSIITGNEKEFAAGADIKEMAEASAIEMLIRDQFEKWDRIGKIKKPLIAAVSGFALGGGCELALMCDIIIASESAQFGQPEINLAIIPGAGGTQRLTRIIGKNKTMEMILTGRRFSAKEMFEAGLVNKIVPNEEYLNEAIKLAKDIASKPNIAVQLAKETILKAYETSFENGLQFERKNFYLLFASDDKLEGMKAFIEKRKPKWKGK